MRKILFLALAASTLAPVAAQAQGGDRHEFRQDQRDVGRGHDGDRQDWRAFREGHREAFRGSPYAGPRGFAYRPVAPGYRFAPDYYHRRYWINNPGAYRLPPAPFGQRWVRYGQDVVRVDLRSGRVIEVHGSFFL